MTPQLELDLSRRERPALRARALAVGGLEACLLWTPLWVPLVFLGQLVVLGLLPARAEGARLDRAEFEMGARVEALEAERLELETRARMLEDDVFRERVRRSLLDPAAEPLTLERARAPSRP